MLRYYEVPFPYHCWETGLFWALEASASRAVPAGSGVQDSQTVQRNHGTKQIVAQIQRLPVTLQGAPLHQLLRCGGGPVRDVGQIAEDAGIPLLLQVLFDQLRNLLSGHRRFLLFLLGCILLFQQPGYVGAEIVHGDAVPAPPVVHVGVIAGDPQGGPLGVVHKHPGG